MPEEVQRKHLDQIQYTHEEDSIIGKILLLVSEGDDVASQGTCLRLMGVIVIPPLELDKIREYSSQIDPFQ